MRVLQLAPIWETVPPPAYGGTEAVVSLLTEGLVRVGVDVSLFASGDSTTSAELRSVWPRSLRTERLREKEPYDWLHVASALSDAREFDLVHNHAGMLGVALSALIDVPMLTTMHCAITPDTRAIWERYRGWYNVISHAQQRDVWCPKGALFAGVVHNSIDVSSFPFQPCKSDYVLFLSRVDRSKGTHLAVEAAQRAGFRLVIAGKVDHAGQEYFDSRVQPVIDGRQVVFLGEANSTQKRELFKNARCLVLPLQWNEPFGLVMTEAMACGTPVVAYRRGAAPEIIAHGETGFVVDTMDEMVEALRQVTMIDPMACRRHVEAHFSPKRMVQRYIECYERILEKPWLLPRTPSDSMLDSEEGDLSLSVA